MGIGIAPISGLGYSMTRIEPLQYPLRNQADISDAYVDSVKKTGSAGIVNPVGYHTARKETEELTGSKKPDAVEANQAFNEVAARFVGGSTGYLASGDATAYQLTGSMFDALA